MKEKRRFLRFETALKAICEIGSDKNKTNYKVQNLSKEGALLVADKQFDPNSTLKLAVEIPGDNFPVFVTCEVAWQGKVTGNNEYYTGVRFTKLDNPDKGRLLEYIYLQWLHMLDKK